MTSKETSKANYLAYKEHGICPQCGIHRAAPSRVRCEECLIKNAESSRKARESKVTKSQKEYHKRLREERKAKGLCVWCGKPLLKNSKCFCIDCRIKNQRKNDRKKSGIDRSERPLYGICYRCGKNPIVPGKKLCEACTKQCIKNLEYANHSEKTMQRREYIRSQNNAIFNNRGKVVKEK